MFEYIVRAPFRMKTLQGHQLVNKGEAIRLSSSKAARLVSSGYLVERHVGLDLLTMFDARASQLADKLEYHRERAEAEAFGLLAACLKRHAALKMALPPTPDFLEQVAEFNRTATGKNPVLKEQSEKGVGEWAGYTCNIGSGCNHGCRYCYAEKMATRFGRVADSEAWQEENLRDVSTAGCKKYDSTIMFPTTHDITPTYLPAYRVHLYNLLEAGNKVLVVSKPRMESIQAICSEFSSFRDNMTFRFTIGGLNGETMTHWEPGAPPLEERLRCLKYAFGQGYATSVSAEPMLGGRDEAVKLYYLLEPFVTSEIWFGKMNNVGGFRGSPDPEVARHAKDLFGLHSDDEIMELVRSLAGLPKVQWKDSIKEVIAKRTGETI